MGSCSWFLLKPQHEVVQQFNTIGEICVEVDEVEDVCVESTAGPIDVFLDVKQLDSGDFVVANYIVQEEPTGVINGINTVFTLLNTPEVGTVAVLLNGLNLTDPDDFTIVGSIVTLVVPPIVGENLRITYLRQ